MQSYTELIPPTAVTHCVSLPFVNAQSQELIVAKSSLLQIFQSRVASTVRPSHPTQLSNGDAGHALVQQSAKKLVLIGEYQLSGTITSLARIKAQFTKSGGEALLISFLNAKVSLVEWNPDAHNLSTISIHYYEAEDLMGSPWAPDPGVSPSYLVADPSSRCAALKFGLRHLAIIPFRQATDDLTMGDYDPDLDDISMAARSKEPASEIVPVKQTPYDASFVLQLTELDPNVMLVIDLAFLYEYREPTLGVLAAAKSPSLGLANHRKDILTYTVFTLDLEQRASTALISVSGLPSDLFQIIALPIPIGGTLLIGGNELVHVDQAGKTHAVGVNDFAKAASGFPMNDQSELGLRLEGCKASHLGSGTSDVLLILSTGNLVTVKFRVDGRTVTGLSVKPISTERGGSVIGTAASCTTALSGDLLFIGSQEGDSLLLQCQGRKPAFSKKRSHAEMLGTNAEELSDEEMEDEDDLYGDDSQQTKPQSQLASVLGNEESTYKVTDRLPNLTSFGEPVLGKRKRTGRHDSVDSAEQLEIAIATGCGSAGSVAFLSRDLVLEKIGELGIVNAERIWAWSPAARGLTDPASTASGNDSGTFTTQFVIISPSTGHGISQVYASTPNGMTLKIDSDFESEVSTVNAGVMYNGTRLVQISPEEVRCYPLDLSFPQIFPMADEETEKELKVRHSFILDPYILIVKDDGSCTLLKIDEKGELDEVELGTAIKVTSWKSGSLYREQGDSGKVMAYLLSDDGNIHVFELPQLDKAVYKVLNIGYLLPYYAPDTLTRRAANRESIDEIIVADLGDEFIQTPHLILRTATNNVVVYQPYQYNPTSDAAVDVTARWMKVADLPATLQDPLGEDEDEDEDEQESGQIARVAKSPMKIIEGFKGYQTVFIPGLAPSLLLKEASSLPRRIRIRNAGQVLDLATFCSTDGTKSVAVAEEQGDGREVSLAKVPTGTQYGHVGWALRRIPQHQHITALCYHPEQELYVVCVNEPDEFQLPEDDDWHPDWSKENIVFKAKGVAGKVKLLDPDLSNIIAEIAVEPDEAVMCAKLVDLEISEITHERRAMVVVGTAIMRGEDQPSNGAIYVYDIIRVVPDPDISGSDRCLKLIVREEVKGAVTSVSGIGDEGFLIAGQGQKLMVRGLKEDGTCLPVAFLDVQTQVIALKNIRGTGLSMIADALKGVWIFGFAPDPNRMRMFGKTLSAVSSTGADCLVHEKQLFIFVTDVECNLHILEYNPEDPKSLSGSRLLHRGAFHTGHLANSVLTLPAVFPAVASEHNTETEGATREAQHSTTLSGNVLITSQSGAIALITPLDEHTYRRLGALQNYLLTLLDHPCGLNPRAYRAVEGEGLGGRGVLDGNILMKWHDLSAQRKAEACTRVGLDAWGVRMDLAVLSGSRTGYL